MQLSKQVVKSGEAAESPVTAGVFVGAASSCQGWGSSGEAEQRIPAERVRRANLSGRALGAAGSPWPLAVLG
jgi:hypothetical protein